MKSLLMPLCTAIAILLSVPTYAQNNKTRANSYDDAWENGWVTHCRSIYQTGSKTSGFVIQVGDSITHANPYSQWPRATVPSAGKTSEDTDICNWAKTTIWTAATDDATIKNGFYLAVADTSGSRGMTASSGITTAEYRNGTGNGGSTMPSDTNTITAPTRVADGVTYTSNLHITTVGTAFDDAQFAVLMLGTNDIIANRSVADFTTDLTSIVDTLEGRNIVVILSTIPPHYTPATNTNVIAYNTAIKAFAQTRGLPLIDFYQEILERQPGTAWNGTLLATNDVHPTGSGGSYTSSSSPYADGGDASTHTTGAACNNVGYLLRSWLTMQKLKEVRDYVADGNDPPSAGTVVTDVSTLSITEGGTAQFQVRLASAPASDTTVTVSHLSGDTDITVSGGASLTFTTGNWSTYQTVTLSAAADVDGTNGTAIINCAATGYSSATVTVTESDTGAYNVQTSSPSISIAQGGTQAFQVRLSAVPAGDTTVTIARTGGDTNITVATTTLTFTAANWSTYQTATINANSAASGGATLTCSVTAGPTTYNSTDVAVNLITAGIPEDDDDSAGQFGCNTGSSSASLFVVFSILFATILILRRRQSCQQ